jgi:hypothetical protein
MCRVVSGASFALVRQGSWLRKSLEVVAGESRQEECALHTGFVCSGCSALGQGPDPRDRHIATRFSTRAPPAIRSKIEKLRQYA